MTQQYHTNLGIGGLSLCMHLAHTLVVTSEFAELFYSISDQRVSTDAKGRGLRRGTRPQCACIVLLFTLTGAVLHLKRFVV